MRFHSSSADSGAAAGSAERLSACSSSAVRAGLGLLGGGELRLGLLGEVPGRGLGLGDEHGGLALGASMVWAARASACATMSVASDSASADAPFESAPRSAPVERGPVVGRDLHQEGRHLVLVVSTQADQELLGLDVLGCQRH